MKILATITTKNYLLTISNPTSSNLQHDNSNSSQNIRRNRLNFNFFIKFFSHINGTANALLTLKTMKKIASFISTFLNTQDKKSILRKQISKHNFSSILRHHHHNAKHKNISETQIDFYCALNFQNNVKIGVL